MQTNISDEELRSMLSKYMDVIPPVTETTRELLLSKLEKFLMAEVQQEDLQPTDVEDLSASALSQSPAKSPRKSHAKPTETLSASEQIPEPLQPTVTISASQEEDYVNPNGTRVSLSFESPREKSSPIYEYISRMPTYRRRSIHPDRPELDSPYADFALPEARSYVSSPLSRGRPMRRSGAFSQGDFGSDESGRGRCLLRVPFTPIVSFLGTVCSVITSTVDRMKLSALPGRISFRFVICLLALGLLIIISAKLLLGDPFYHNPVNDLRGWMQRL